MQKRRSRVMTVLCIVLLAGLLAGAFLVPQWLNVLYDKQNLGQVHNKELEFELYEPTYADFEDKVHAIGMAVADGATLQLIELSAKENDEEGSVWQGLSVTEEEIQEELKQLFNELLQIELDVELLELNSCKLYTVLGTGENSDTVLSGIQVYEMSYGQEIVVDVVKDKKKLKYDELLRLYVDAEFHKIYAFDLLDEWRLLDYDYYCLEEADHYLKVYWDIDKKYDIYADSYEYRSNFLGDVYWERLFEVRMDYTDNARIYVAHNEYGDEVYKWARIGMQPFFNAFDSPIMEYFGVAVSD